ncbi:hypothetical protein T4A_9056, partial [Trichinella pseudospiralis]
LQQKGLYVDRSEFFLYWYDYNFGMYTFDLVLITFSSIYPRIQSCI